MGALLSAAKGGTLSAGVEMLALAMKHEAPGTDGSPPPAALSNWASRKEVPANHAASRNQLGGFRGVGTPNATCRIATGTASFGGRNRVGEG